MPKSQTNAPIEIKISTVVAVCAILRDCNPLVLDAALKKMTGGIPGYFDHEFAVLDLAGCEGSTKKVDWPSLISLFKSYSLNPVAVRNAPAEFEEEIIAHGLSIDIVAKPRAQDEDEFMAPEAAVVATSSAAAVAPVATAAATSAAAASTAQIPEFAGAMIIDSPVRAGQRIYARGRDLIVTGVVNNGAELIADGSIHIYAPLRGRALAGASGNVGARIFTMGMEAELVSIAGTYRTFERGLPEDVMNKPAQVRLVGDRIDVLSLHTRA